MASRQRYERLAAVDENDDHASSLTMTRPPLSAIPNSPPPSFRSRNSSRRTSRDELLETVEERNLRDAFDAPSDESEEDEDHDDDEQQRTPDQRRLIPGTPSVTDRTQQHSTISHSTNRPPTQRTVTEIPAFAPSTTTTSGSRTMGINSQANDGVWANLNAKPRPGEEVEEKPPTYEQAAADATPPYWETTVLSPYGVSGNPDDVFIDGLLVGSVFSFIWNALISMSFQLIGFLLTYLLHTTHAAKHGSRAGLGITLVQYGFQMRYTGAQSPLDGPGAVAPTDGIPDNPNKHDFDPDNMAGGSDSSAGGFIGDMSTMDWLSYALMIVGWFILIRALGDFMKARRAEALVRSSPDRGLGVAVVAEGESPESSV